MTPTYPKRLIEVDLPIKRISAHARREKSIRHGHISTLHIWWARRPLAACRAVTCAALWPDPADENCPPAFRVAASRILNEFAAKVRGDVKLGDGDQNLRDLCSPESFKRWQRTKPASLKPDNAAHLPEMRMALLDFIADFAKWDASTVPAYLDAARALTQAAHEALGGEPGTRPLVVDPFAGGGAIPLEALRVGADTFASDLNPVAVLLNKVVLEYIPKYGPQLADEVRKWGAWVKEEAEKELAQFYPKDPDGSTPIAYLWARTITCEGPHCGAEVPLMRSLWLAKKPKRMVAMQIVPDKKAKRVDFRIIVKRDRDGWKLQDDEKQRVESPKFDGTVKRGAATCPCCGYVTPVERVRAQLSERRGGASTARLFCVVTTSPVEQGRSYRLPVKRDLDAVQAAAKELERRKAAHRGPLSLVPDEMTPKGGGSGAGRAFSQRRFGMSVFADIYTKRQLLTLSSLAELANKAAAEADSPPVRALLGLAVSRMSDRASSLCTWRPQADQEKIEHVFARNALSITWDFAEGSPLSVRTAGWTDAYEPPLRVIESSIVDHMGRVERASANASHLPDNISDLVFTDPPYYDAIPYADLSDYFYVWLRRIVREEIDVGDETPKWDECILDETKGKDSTFFIGSMTQALSEARRAVNPRGLAVVVFAHKSTAGWEAQLQAIVDAGWVMTGSWPIDTEMGTRLRAQGSAALASSVHLVCRPREDANGNVRDDEIGDWRVVLGELPKRIHEWMPRLHSEGIVGADAIFACLGPALEIFSRYSRVEKASGEVVTLREYLEHVWAAVSREALSMVFNDPDTAGLEPDARLTAMWLWTLTGGVTGKDAADSKSTDSSPLDDDAESASDDDDENEGGGTKKSAKSGYALEYDAARKIAQGLGARLEELNTVVEVKGDKARLLPVSERAQFLFARVTETQVQKRRERKAQGNLFATMDEYEAEVGVGELGAAHAGATMLDKVHQAMLLFGTSRSEALRRFLVDEGVGKTAQFWKLSDSLSKLYPSGSEEKRWVDGVLARKKGLGFG